MSSCGWNTGMEMSAPLINAIVNNAVSPQVAHQSDAASNHSYPVLFLADSLSQ